MEDAMYIDSEKELNRVVESVLQLEKEGERVFLLRGELGSGKTTLIRRICRGFGVPEREMSSPSFAMINQYRGSDGRNIFHMDLYRVKEEDELFELGFEEFLNSGDICFIEWPDVAQNFFSGDHVNIEIQILDQEKRRIEIRK